MFALVLFITVGNASATNVTADQVANASGSVTSYVKTNHTLPNSVNVSGNVVNMSNYLGLSTSALLNINNSSPNASITIKSFGGAPSPSENVTSRTITKAEYLDMAKRVRSYMDTNGRAPNYVTQTSTGSTIRYESLIYMFSQILNYYNTNKSLPSNITVNPWTIVTNPNVIGSTSYGYVEKKFYGNQSSNQTIVLIIGVHPQENGIHTAIYNALVSKSSTLTKRYVLYYVHVTQDANDYNKGRMNGQLLGQQFIVPDVSSETPMLVLDCHENHGADSGYAYYRFLYPISNTNITTTYANEIIRQMPFLVIYSPPNPTSTQYVTVPIANQGITTLIYETYTYDSATKKASDANTLINALDSLNNGTTNATVTANPSGGSFNTPQIVSLTKTDPDNTATIYYTTDGSDPSTSNTKTKYTDPIIINSNTTLRYSTVDSVGNWGPVYNETYILDTKAPTVTANPVGGNYHAPQKVVLTAIDDQDGNPTIYYTTDGSNPKTSSTCKQYTSPIDINSTTTLNFYAFDGTGHESQVLTAKYNIYKSVRYSYTVKVAYKKGWYKYWYKVSYKKWYKSWYKYKGKWKYKWKYKWAVKSKYKWKYGCLYKNVVKYGTKYLLT